MGGVCKGLVLQGPTGAMGSYIRVAIYKSNHISGVYKTYGS